jgi:membrane protein
LQLVKATTKKLGEDELSTRSAALSYYFLLALFPLLLFLLSLLGIFAGANSQMRESIVAGLGRMAPGSASSLVHSVIDQTFKASSGIKLAAGVLGALWAASGGMGAIVVSLNVIHRAKETRPWWKQRLTTVGLTVALAVLVITGLVLALYGGKIGDALTSYIGLSSAFQVAWKAIEWIVSFGAMFLSFSLVYYFGPDIEDRRWYWVTPGAVVGVALWLLSSLGFRIYLHFFNNYSATYGSLGAVIILMLWLYMTGLAILVGGELNFVIEAEGKRVLAFEAAKTRLESQLSAA